MSLCGAGCGNIDNNLIAIFLDVGDVVVFVISCDSEIFISLIHITNCETSSGSIPRIALVPVVSAAEDNGVPGDCWVVEGFVDSEPGTR